MINQFLLPIWTLVQREVIRFYRQRSRVIGAFVTPLVFWLVIGSGMNSSFYSAGFSKTGYQEYFFPGIIVMILLFTAIFSMISIIEDRREGFLQGVLVSPVSRSSIVIGKVVGATTVSVLQALLFTLLSYFIDIQISFFTFLLLAGVFVLISINLTLFGFLMAWRSRSIQGFHVMMNLFLFPMWLLSGAAFPSEGAPVWLEWLMRINPLTYSVLAVRKVIYLSMPLHNDLSTPSLFFSFMIILATGGILFLLSLMEVNRPKMSTI